MLMVYYLMPKCCSEEIGEDVFHVFAVFG